jgi:hypothetical protein
VHPPRAHCGGIEGPEPAPLGLVRPLKGDAITTWRSEDQPAIPPAGGWILLLQRELQLGPSADLGRRVDVRHRELSKVTFSEYAEQWVDTYTGRTSRGVRPATLADYKRILEREATPFFGQMRLAEIEPQHVKRYAKAVADRWCQAQHSPRGRGAGQGSVCDGI